MLLIEGSEIMVMPKQSEIEVPLLEALIEIGGEGKPQDIYPLVTKRFPNLTKEDIEEKMDSGGNKWTNRIQWVRMKLIDTGEMVSPARGIWAITDKGRKRVNSPTLLPSAPVNFVELYEDYEDDVKTQLLDALHELTPRQFELFGRKFLEAYGFVNLDVTDIGPDGGIDGFGRLKVGLATMNVAFQCKRWQGNVGSKEIQQFRGAIQGKYEQGIFFTTSDFTRQAMELSFQQGAVPIVLMNGSGIVDIMIEKGFGVKKKPLYFYEKIENFLEE